jgi:stearoyl-CoA desaturase (delta-9 desaturase)
MFVKTRSLDEIVERAHRMILETVGARLGAIAPLAPRRAA